MGPLARHEEFAERFGVDIYTAFGMAEVPVPIVSGLNPKDEKSQAAPPTPSTTSCASPTSTTSLWSAARPAS